MQPQRVHQGGGAGHPGAAGEADEGIEGAHVEDGGVRGVGGQDEAQGQDARQEVAQAGHPDQVEDSLEDRIIIGETNKANLIK